MAKFVITQSRVFDVEVEADDMEHAIAIAKSVAAKYPAGIMKTLSVVPAPAELSKVG